MKHYSCLYILFLLSACSSQPTIFDLSEPSSSEKSQLLTSLNSCRAHINSFHTLVKSSAVQDAQYNLIKSHPHLAVDRFLSFMANKAITPNQRKEWLQHAFQLAEEKFTIENENLPKPLSAPQKKKLTECAERLLNESLRAAETKPFPFTAKYDDNYSLFKRTLGLYPISKLFVSSAVTRLHEELTTQYGQALPKNTLTWGPEINSKLSDNELKRIINTAKARSSLNTPTPSQQELTQLFQHYAPRWAIEQKSTADLPGKITIDREGRISIDPLQVVIYQNPSYTLWHNDQVLLQLNYSIWFPERPKQGHFDLYGGFLDGLIWRVTLDSEGRALFYDSIHQCGCYYQSFPVQENIRQQPVNNGQEPLLALPIINHSGSSDDITIHLSGNDHYIRAISSQHNTSPHPNKVVSHTYTTASYNQLRSLPAGNGNKSIFNHNGLIQKSKRSERWIFWPMGVASPGAMRQWGHHAIAFVGRRHFDDPELFTIHFDLADQ